MENQQINGMLKLARGLFFLNATVWLIFGILGFIQARAGGGTLRIVLSGLMVANAVVMAWLGLMIISGKAWVFFLAILYQAINVVLSVTDQFGWIDALILLLNLSLLGVLFVTRQRINQTAWKPTAK